MLTLVNKHCEITDNLTRAIKLNDEAAVRAFDKLAASSFETILLHECKNTDDRSVLTKFLLDKLKPNNCRTQLEKRICDKILNLMALEKHAT